MANMTPGATLTPKMQPSPTVAGQPSATNLPSGFGTAQNVTTPTPPLSDPTLTAQLGLNETNYNNTLSGLNTQQTGVISEFGLDDPTDPFSKAALLQRLYNQNQAKITGGMAARGQLYSGALQSEQNNAGFNYLQGRDALRKAQNAALARIASARTAAASTKAQADINAGSAATDRAVNAPLSTQTVPGKPAPKKGVKVPPLRIFGRP